MLGTSPSWGSTAFIIFLLCFHMFPSSVWRHVCPLWCLGCHIISWGSPTSLSAWRATVKWDPTSFLLYVSVNDFEGGIEKIKKSRRFHFTTRLSKSSWRIQAKTAYLTFLILFLMLGSSHGSPLTSGLPAAGVLVDSHPALALKPGWVLGQDDESCLVAVNWLGPSGCDTELYQMYFWLRDVFFLSLPCLRLCALPLPILLAPCPEGSTLTFWRTYRSYSIGDGWGLQLQHL